MQSTCGVSECGRTELAKGLCQPHYDRLRRYGDLALRPPSFVCSDCGSTSEMPTRGKQPDSCKECQTAKHRLQMLADRRRKNLQYGYGMTLADYDSLLERQGGVCAICGGPPNGRGRRYSNFAVDHDHKTGAVRGLLCSNCNTGIGNLRDDIALLKLAIKYLEASNG